MSRARSLCTALFAVLVMSAATMVATALGLALPDVHVLSGEGYPVTSTGEVTGTAVGRLETELGEKLTSGTVRVETELGQLSSLGSDLLTFTGVLEPKSKTSCNTAGDSAGTVLLSGEYHVVDTSTSPLVGALLLLFKELPVECNSGKLKVKVRSPGLAKLEKVGSGLVDTTSYGLVAKCTGKGKPEVKTYLNDEGATVKATLSANFGLGFETACENVEQEVVMTSSKMLNFEGAGPEPEPTTLSTTLSGEGKEGDELTVLEGSKVKDKATLSGTNASKAAGAVTYKVYSDKECKTLVTSAGEVTVSGGAVPASSEEELEGGKTYYWQAHYGGDVYNVESTSPCNEVLSVKAKTTLSLKLAGGGVENEEIVVAEGTSVKGKATLSGTNSSTATGTVAYKVYSDSGCKTLLTSAGEVAVSGGTVPNSSEKTLEGGAVYYWQATYSGDALHQASTSKCGAIVFVKPPAPRIERVDFQRNSEVVIDHKTNTEEPAADQMEFDGDTVEWKSPKLGEVAKNWPVAYVHGESIELQARFEVEATTRKFLEKNAEGSVTLTGSLTLKSTSMKFMETLTVEAVKKQLEKHSGYIETGTMTTAPTDVPNAVFHERQAIFWEWQAQAKGGLSFKQEAGDSHHNFYSQFATPIAKDEDKNPLPPIFLSLLTLATTGGEAAGSFPSESEVIEGIWGQFTGLDVQTTFYDPATDLGEPLDVGTSMTYYKEIVKAGENLKEVYAKEIANNARVTECPGVPVQDMLRTYAGRCGAWAQALWSTLADEGILSKLISLEVKYGSGQCAVQDECVLLVKNWKFGAGSLVGPFVFTSSEVTDEEGAAAQSVKNPPPFFWDHEIVKAGPALYDPSYGTGPFFGTESTEKPSEISVLEEYQEHSISGFCAPNKEGEKSPAEPVRCEKSFPGIPNGLWASGGFKFP